MVSNDELNKLYDETFAECKTLEDEKNVLINLKYEYKDEIREMYCNSLLYTISRGYTKYNQKNYDNDELIKTYLQIVELLPSKYTYFHLTYNFFKKNNNKCLAILEELISSLYEEVRDKIEKPEQFIDENLFIDMFFEPFKQAFKGFWPYLGCILRKYPVQEGIPELCDMIEEYYTCKTDDEALDLLLNMMQKHPNLILIKELIGYTYYSMKMWNNAIAYFESVEDKSIFFFDDDLYFMLAWSCGKTKKHKEEESYYRKALEINPNNINCLNNLGYSLYLQKKYLEALPCFEKCLEIDSSYIYASNNYLRVLIAIGRNKDAKMFAKSNKYKISKDIIKRVEKLDNTNARIKKEPSKINTDQWAEDHVDSQKNSIDLGVKRQQFSNEKLLEDELTSRIESGAEVFGLQLKIYKRKGVYGRQYVIPIGRLDLLCEDANGDLYIIELKKDSGYDDAYKQTVAYLEWFEQSGLFKNKKIHGIICVNSPTQDLINKVHKDNRIRLFEYSISYTEM